jgi:hypothetical protein
MLWDASAIHGFSLQPKDGMFDNVSDLLFDRDLFSPRWLVAEAELWLGRKVDLPISAVGRPAFDMRAFKVDVTLAELRAHHEMDEQHLEKMDAQLVSVSALIDSAFVVSDGSIGHVGNVLVYGDDMALRFLTVHTSNWWPGVKVLIARGSIVGTDTNERVISLDINVDRVKAAPVFDAATTLDGIEDSKFLTYFGVRWVAS